MRHIRSEATAALDELGHAADGYADTLRELGGGDAERIEEFFLQNQAGMFCGCVLLHHFILVLPSYARDSGVLYSPRISPLAAERLAARDKHPVDFTIFPRPHIPTNATYFGRAGIRDLWRQLFAR